MATTVPIFVVGSPRSGTTLVREMLRTVEGIYLLPDEFQLLEPFVKAVDGGVDPLLIATQIGRSPFGSHMRRRGLWPGEEHVAGALRGRTPPDALRELVLVFAQAEEVGSVRYWGDKSPENAEHVELIRALWPDARIINVRRDPRDCVASMRGSWGRSIRRSSLIWRRCVRSVLDYERARSADSSVLTLDYDAVISSPISAMKGLSSWLDLPFDEAALRGVQSNERWGRAKGSDPVVVLSGWRDRLNQRQVRLVEEICFDEMVECGYEVTKAEGRVDPRPTMMSALRFLDAIRALISYSRERGPAEAIDYKFRQWSSQKKWADLMSSTDACASAPHEAIPEK